METKSYEDDLEYEHKVEELVLDVCAGMGFNTNPYDSDDHDIQDVLRDAKAHALCLRRMAEKAGFKFDDFNALTAEHYTRLVADNNVSESQLALQSFVDNLPTKSRSFADEYVHGQMPTEADAFREALRAMVYRFPPYQTGVVNGKIYKYTQCHYCPGYAPTGHEIEHAARAHAQPADALLKGGEKP